MSPLDTHRPDGSPVALEPFIQRHYRCPGCRRSWSSASAARQHVEQGCRRDPANRGCLSCRHFRQGSNGYIELGRALPGDEPTCDEVVPEFVVRHPANDFPGLESEPWIEYVLQMSCPSWEKR